MIGSAKIYLIGGAALLAVLLGVFWAGWAQRGSQEREKELMDRLETRHEVDRIKKDVQKLDGDDLADRISDPRGVQ